MCTFVLFLPFRKHCLGVVDRVSGRVLVETVKDPDSESQEGNKVEEKKKKEEKDGGGG